MKHWFSSLVLLGSGLFLTGCNGSQGFVAQLSLQVQPSSRSGTYALSGETNLPEGTELIIQGVRRLENLDGATTPLESDQFSILDRKIVKVSEGQWEANLSVWQPGPEGELAEPWQLYGLQEDERFQPLQEIQFTATAPPSNDAKALERQWEASQTDPDGQQIGFTTEGRWYLQASQQLSLAPPSVSELSKESGKAAIVLGQVEGSPAVAGTDPAVDGSILKKPVTNAALSSREQFQ